jgi:very-short-patch-repair endonuclease
MGIDREGAFQNKSQVRRPIWSISPAEADSEHKSVPRATICAALLVDGTGEPALGEVATGQEGVVHGDQLAGLGFTRSAVSHRVSRGRLHRLYPCVYAVGHTGLSRWAKMLAALLYARRDCVLSHASAAALWGLVALPEDIELTQAGRQIRSRAGLRVFRVHSLDVRDVRLQDGLPVTAPAQTLIDLAARPMGFERALAEARVRGLVTDDELLAAMDRCRGRSGVARLRRLLAEGDGGPTRSEAERRLLNLVRQAGLPAPASNVALLGFEVDFLWRSERLVLEVDGYAFHAHRGAFERDRRRDQALVAAGFRVIRVTWRQLRDEPMAVVVRLAQALTAM